MPVEARTARPQLRAAQAPTSVVAATGGRVIASPLARKLAREAGIDLTAKGIVGSGPGGRIVASDVLQAAVQPAPVTMAAAAPGATVPVSMPVTVANNLWKLSAF